MVRVTMSGIVRAVVQRQGWPKIARTTAKKFVNKYCSFVHAAVIDRRLDE